MEEWVGFKWHEYITRQAMGEFPEHAVHLKDEARTLGVLFRAMGGDPALSLVTAEPRHFRTRRRFLQKLAGTHKNSSWPGGMNRACGCRNAWRCFPRNRSIGICTSGLQHWPPTASSPTLTG